MYLTHTFAHHETLSRAYSWLAHLGFHPRRIDSPASAVARLMIPVAPDRLAAAQMLINAVESADADGFPSFWHKPGSVVSDQLSNLRTPISMDDTTAAPPQGKPQSSVIGWHPLD